MDSEYIIEVLEEQGYLENGKTIPKELLENLLNTKATLDNSWNLAIMPLMDALKKKGFFSSIRKCPRGCLRILELKEYADKAKNGIVSSYKKQKKNKNVLDKCLNGHMDDPEAKNIYHVRNLIILHEHAMKSVLHNL